MQKKKRDKQVVASYCPAKKSKRTNNHMIKVVIGWGTRSLGVKTAPPRIKKEKSTMNKTLFGIKSCNMRE